MSPRRKIENSGIPGGRKRSDFLGLEKSLKSLNPFIDTLLSPKKNRNPVEEEAGRGIKTILKTANLFTIDLETTGNALINPNARVVSYSMGRFGTPAQKVYKQKIGNTSEDIGSFFQDMGKGDINTIYFSTPTEVPERFEKGMVPIAGLERKVPGTKDMRTLRELLEGSSIKWEPDLYSAFERTLKEARGGVVFAHNAAFDLEFLHNIINDPTSEVHAKRREEVAAFIDTTSNVFSEGQHGKLSEGQRLKNAEGKILEGKELAIELSRLKSFAKVFPDSHMLLQEDWSEVLLHMNKAKISKGMAESIKIKKDLTKSATSYLQTMVSLIKNQKASSTAMIIDPIHFIMASNVLLQNQKYVERNYHLFNGTNMDTLWIARRGIPLSHSGALDVKEQTKVYIDILKNRIAPLLQGEKLSYEEIAKARIESHLGKIDLKKNIINKIYSLFLGGIEESEKKGGGRGLGVPTGEIQTEKYMQISQTEGVRGINKYTQKYVRVPSQDIEEQVAQNIRAIYGQGHIDSVKDQLTFGSHIYERYKRQQEAQGVPSGTEEYKTLSGAEATGMLSKTQRATEEAYKQYKFVEGFKLRTIMDKGLSKNVHPLISEYFFKARETLKLGLGNSQKNWEEFEEIRKIIARKRGGEYKEVEGLQKRILEGVFAERVRKIRMKGVLGVGLSLALFAAAKRRGDITDLSRKEALSQEDYEERFNWYLNETGSALQNGSPDYLGGILSPLRRESYNQTEGLGYANQAVETDFSSPFIKPKVSTPMARQMVSTPVASSVQRSVPARVQKRTGLSAQNKSLNREIFKRMKNQMQRNNYVGIDSSSYAYQF